MAGWLVGWLAGLAGWQKVRIWLVGWLAGLVGWLAKGRGIWFRSFQASPDRCFFVPVSYDLGQFRWISATTDFLVRNVGEGTYLRTLPLLYCWCPETLSYVPFGAARTLAET